MLQNDLDQQEVFESSETNAMNVINSSDEKSVDDAVKNSSLSGISENVGWNIPKTEKWKLEFNKEQFRNSLFDVNKNNILSLNDEQINILFDAYLHQLDTYLIDNHNKEDEKRWRKTPFEISQINYINIPEDVKKNVIFDVLKPNYINYIYNNVSTYANPDKRPTKWNDARELMSWPSYAEKGTVLLDFKNVLWNTDVSSLYNLVEYLDSIKNDLVVSIKASSALLKPINDQPKGNWLVQWMYFPNQKFLSSSSDSFVGRPRDKVDYRWQDAVSVAGWPVQYNYELRKENLPKFLSEQVNKIFKESDENTKYTYTLTVSEDQYASLKEDFYFKPLLPKFSDIKIVPEEKVFNIHEEKEYFDTKTYEIKEKVPWLDFNQILSGENIADLLKKYPELSAVISEPEKYALLDWAKVIWCASHVPTDHTPEYNQYMNIKTENLSQSWSENNNALAKDRAYWYINYLSNIGLWTANWFTWFDMEYKVDWPTVEEFTQSFEQENNRTPNSEEMQNYFRQYQYAEIYLPYKKLLKEPKDYTVTPDEKRFTPINISFSYIIPERPVNP